MFSVKGPRYAVNRRVLAEAGDSIKRFLDSGVLELGDKLGPILWQFAPTKKFDAADFGKFLELLPAKLDGRKLRHVVEVRHDSFCTPEFIALVRKFARRWCSPSTTSIRPLPIRSAISSTRACRRATTRSPPPIRRSSSTPGPSAPALGQGRRARRPAAGRLRTSRRKTVPRDVFVYFIHQSFCVPEFIALVRKFNTPVVFAEHDNIRRSPTRVGDFVYARLQKGDDTIPTAYPPKQLDAWAECARLWAKGAMPEGLPLADSSNPGEESPARRVRLLHPRGQGPRPRRRHGPDRARGEVTSSPRRREPSAQISGGVALRGAPHGQR